MKIKKILSQINYLNFSKKFKSKNLEEDFFIYFPYECVLQLFLLLNCRLDF